MTPRAITPEEGRAEFFDTVTALFKYWETLPTDQLILKPGQTELNSRMSGFLFSLFNVIDGSNMSLPAFNIVACPHPDDRQYCIDNGENYWEGVIINDDPLHEVFDWSKLE